MNPMLLLGLAFFIPLFFSVPIAIALGIAALLSMMIFELVPVNYFIQSMFLACDSFTMLAVPFFILAGDIMLHGGISRRLIDFCRTLMGHKTGAMGMVTVMACMIFAAISGSGPATVAAIGGIMIPEMIKDGYEDSFAGTLAAAAGSMGPIIPPSITFVMYGIVAGVSIGDLFVAGIVPGIMMGIALMIVVAIVARKYHFGTIRPKATWKEKWDALKEAFLALMVPVIILGGIYSGMFTPTEAAVISCDYGLIIGIFVFKEIKVKDLPMIFGRTALTCGSCLILVACANCFGKVLTLEGVPGMLSDFIYSISTNKIVVLMLINLILFVIGMFMETVAAVLIIAPLFVSIVVPLGVDPVHFGVIMVVNLALGMCTPPVGANLFIASRIGNIRLESMFKWLFPLIGSLLVTLMVITYVPPCSTFLVNIFR